MTKAEIFGNKLKNGDYDQEITKVLLDWQVENANKRIQDFLDNLNSAYDGEPLSVIGLSSAQMDELLHLGRELHQETRRAYLKANLAQYLHDLGYVKNPTIHITDAEWATLHGGHIAQLEVLRNWAEKTIEAIEVEGDTETPIESTEAVVEAPVKRGRKNKNTEEK